ncbi:aspartate-semialdehyde dehydrogenase [Candidatus Vidania fulgoroideorum]
MKKKIAVLGCRGLVGKTFIKRIKKNKINYNLFSFLKEKNEKIYFSNCFLKKIIKYKFIVLCKTKNFSKYFYKKLIKNKWKGYLIDASSQFRLSKKSVLSLDLINKKKIQQAIKNGLKIFCGCNCTVSILLIALKNIINKNTKKIICNTYQSVSGAGFKETFNLFKNCNKVLNKIFKNNKFYKNLNKYLKKNFKKNNYLSFSLTPWIGGGYSNSEEEEKTYYETNKLLGLKIKIYSTCVRVNSFRCHSEAVTVFFKTAVTKTQIINNLKKNKYVKIVDNNKQQTIKKLNPLYVSGKDKIYIGRIRKLNKKTYSFFIVGDQLIWGAAEPLIRTLKILLKNA